MSSLTDLPNDVLIIILQNISKTIIRTNMSTPSNAIKTLLRLESTSKDLNKIIKDEIWKTAWDTFSETNDDLKEITKDSTNPKECLLLHSLTGCQFCQIPRIRKIYTEFQVRCCKDCLYKKTISDYRLGNDYFVNISKVQDLPSITRELWNRQVGSYILNFYWIDQVEEKIGMSLQEYHRLEKEKRDIIAREREEARIIQEKIQKEKLIEEMCELSSNDPKYMCLDKKCIESFVKTCKNTSNNIIELLNNLLQSYNVKQFDKVILKSARLQKISIIDIRKTDIYKQKVSNAVLLDFTMDEWDTIYKQIFHNNINKANTETHRIPMDYLTRSDLYNDFCRELKLPNSDEWMNILAQVDANKKQNIKDDKSVKSKKKKKKRLQEDVKTLICPHCTDETRKFSNIGLASHKRDAHRLNSQI